MPRPVHFEIQASDPAVLQAFYESVFGWTFNRWGEWDEQPYWLITTGEASEAGIDGGMLSRNGPSPQAGQPVNAFVVVIDVPDCAAYLQRALDAGGTQAVPLTAVPGVGWSAYVQDPDGNLIGLMQEDTEAA